jgi:hypothetical protein
VHQNINNRTVALEMIRDLQDILSLPLFSRQYKAKMLAEVIA